MAVCVYAAVIETQINKALTAADVRDPDIDHQHLTAQRALREHHRIHGVNLTGGGRHITLTTRRNQLQNQFLVALDIDTRTWDKVHIT